MALHLIKIEGGKPFLSFPPSICSWLFEKSYLENAYILIDIVKG